MPKRKSKGGGKLKSEVPSNVPTEESHVELPEPTEELGAVGGVPSLTELMREKFVLTERNPIETTETIARIIPKRPGLGTKGYEIQLDTNHMIINPGNQIGCLFQYDVDIRRVKSIKQRKLTKDVAQEAYWNAVKHSGANLGVKGIDIFYDQQKMMFSLIDYGTEPVVMTTNDQFDKSSPWQVIIRQVGTVNPLDYKLTVYDANLYERNRVQLQALELLMRQGILFNDNFTNLGRSFFAVQTAIDLGCGKELLKGFYMSNRVIDNWKLSLNVDVTAAVFLKQQSLVQFVMETLNLRETPKNINHHQLKELNKLLKGVFLKTNHLKTNIKLRMDRLSEKTARSHTFILEKDGKSEVISVFDYFKRDHKRQLKYPDWPLVKQRDRMYPIEVCQIGEKNRLKNRQINVLDQARMIRESAVTPMQRKAAILNMLKQSGIAEDERMKNFGVSVAMNMTQLTGRVLTPPKLEYNGNAKMDPNPGEWQIGRNRLISPAMLKSWAIVNLSPRKFVRGRNVDVTDEMIGFFVERLIETGMKLGMPMFQPPRKIITAPPNLQDANVQQFAEIEFAKLLKAIPDMELLMVIMKEKSSSVYAEIKSQSESLIDVVSQCLRSDLILQTWDDYGKSGKTQQMLANIVFKINVKMGGVNTQIDRLDPIAKRYLNEPVLIIGADVTHPDPGDEFSPSIAAICGNIDNHPSHFVAIEQVQIRKNKGGREVIEGFQAAVKQLLLEYNRHTKLKPNKIIVYRDGVSEGQFAEVIDYELRAIQAACNELSPSYKPGITFMVVQKRHHTRFFRRQMNPNDRATQQNIPAGTVVDKGVVHPAEFDFYLCSHIGIQGTSKPTHYHILWDDNKFAADDLQLLTYFLCYTYARCTRSVSIPAPCYYAHHIAFRARHRLMSRRAVMDSDTESVMTGESGVGLGFDGNNPEDVRKMNELIKPGPKTVCRQYWQ